MYISSSYFLLKEPRDVT